MMKYVALLLSLGALIGVSCKNQIAKPVAVSSNPNSLLWKISKTGSDQVSYLYGTFHLLCKEDVLIAKPVDDAIAAADEVYFELDLDDPSTMLSAMFFINMKNDTTLSQLLTVDELKRVSNFFRDTIGTPITMFQRMKPALLEAFLYPSMLNCKNSSGVEQELLVKVSAAKKTVLGLETIQDQTSVFDKIPYGVQAKSLLKSVDSFATSREKFAEMVTNYKAQRLDLLSDALDVDTEGLAGYLDELLYQRNRNWVKKLTTILPSKNLFIAVGAGHLPGDQGLIDLLRNEGFVVEPVAN
jgi:hypothetical protein